MHGGKETVKVVHRVALFDTKSRLTHIVSQSDIARYAALISNGTVISLSTYVPGLPILLHHRFRRQRESLGCSIGGTTQ